MRQGQVWIQPDQPGFHILTSADSQQLLAANADPAAGLHIAPRQLAPASSRVVQRGVAAAGFATSWLLAAAALCVLGLDSWRRGRR